MSLRHRLHRLSVVALFVAASACSDATGNDLDLSGTWSYEATLTASGNGAVCVQGPTVLTLSHSGSELTGTLGPGSIVCPGAMTPTSWNLNLTVTGELEGDSVEFVIDGAYWTHTGTASNGAMSGDVTLTASVAGATGTLTGTWVAEP